METNEIPFKASWAAENRGAKPTNILRLFFRFSCPAALEATHDTLHDATVLIMQYAEGLAPTDFSSESHTPAVSGRTTCESVTAFSSITVCCLLVLHDTALALELVMGANF